VRCYRWKTVTGRKSERVDTSRFYSIVRHALARARPFFHLVFFHNLPPRVRRPDEKVLSTLFKLYALAVFDIEDWSENLNLGIAAVQPILRLSIIREKSQISLCKSLRRLFDGVEIFPSSEQQRVLVYCLQLNNIT